MPNLMSPYAPVRYRGVPWWEYSRMLARLGWVTSEGGIGAGLYEKIDEEFISPMLEEAIHDMKASGHEAEIGMASAQIHELPHWMIMAAQFEQCGREIFDLGNCTLEDWHPPYDAFFFALWQATFRKA
jgi:hypothetical protein